MKLPAAPTWFLIFALSFGGLLALILPPGQVPDEYQHFGRAYALSEGHLLPTISQLPYGISQVLQFNSNLPFHPENQHHLKDLLELRHLSLQAGQRVPQAIPAASVYSPLPYLFSASGIFLARVMGLSPLWIFYAGRLANLVLWTSLCFLALRLTPVFRWVFLLLMLAPMSLNQAVSYSADSLTNAICFLWLCLCLRFACDGKAISWQRIAGLLLFAVILPLTKPPYAMLLLAVAIIPAARFISHKQRLFFVLAMLALAVPLLVASSRINRTYYYAQLKFPGVNAQVQQTTLLRQPSIFLKAMLVTAVEDAQFMHETFVGMLGWLDTRLPAWIYWSYPLALLLTALSDSTPGIRLAAWQKAWLAAAGVIAFTLVAAGQWITWTPLAARKVSDIQGRYLIPIAPTILLTLYNQCFTASRRLLPYLIPAYIILTLSITLLTVVKRYFVL